MDNVKNDAYYIQKIIKDLEFIVAHMRDMLNYQPKMVYRSTKASPKGDWFNPVVSYIVFVEICGEI